MPDECGMLSPPGRGRIPVAFDGARSTLEGNCPDCGARAARDGRLSVKVRGAGCNRHRQGETASWQT